MQWFVQQQRLEAHLRPVDHAKIAACDECCASQAYKHHSAMPKRKMTEYHTEEGRSQTALDHWEHQLAQFADGG